jgi:hypothetical protein
MATTIAVGTTSNPELIAKLGSSASQLDRPALLPNNADWLFDFSAQNSTYTFSPGGVTNMNAANFPAAKGHGLTRTCPRVPITKTSLLLLPTSQTPTIILNLLINATVAVLNLGPCSLLPPHFHPRGANFVVAKAGNTTTCMYGENGAQHTITEILTPMKATIFPQGSLHMMVNNGTFHHALILSIIKNEIITASKRGANLLIDSVVNKLFSLPTPLRPLQRRRRNVEFQTTVHEWFPRGARECGFWLESCEFRFSGKDESSWNGKYRGNGGVFETMWD